MNLTVSLDTPLVRAPVEPNGRTLPHWNPMTCASSALPSSPPDSRWEALS